MKDINNYIKMISFNDYIIEKLKINKDTNPDSDINNLYKVEDIILDYLEEHKYFGYNHNDFDISKKQDTGDQRLYVFLIYKQKDFYKNAKKVGKEINDIINNTLSSKWWCSLNYIDAIAFSDTYIGGDL